eukprot:CAMPEP_0184660406 /NCGR_PEP_ID=MMETSP0308-20130426/33776_1 /TAXON_ID=38269 /ORGANISM="Gloeochaete witrockiana, Strain SAG 46.84" /LENGTH=569 /DNA_ID=CAMNT_0027100967 /DNA_START=15 /DNA_END=1721 /DNA_ORIENTATION=-
MSHSRAKLLRRLALASAAGLGLLAVFPLALSQDSHLPLPSDSLSPPPPRSQNLKDLQRKHFDILVIGGGATGSGVALDAVTRGLNCALIERDDFSSGTSSKSTKLIHGGVRYLEKAFWNLDLSQFRLVDEALHERKHLLRIAPNNAHGMPIMVPCYKWWELPYYWAGVKAYDLVAGSARGVLPLSHLVLPSEAKFRFPMLNQKNLKGAIVYYDGMHNDSRMNIAIALTAAGKGATVANHVEAVKLLMTNGHVSGATVRDTVTGTTFDVHAKVVINACGPFVDTVRELDKASAAPMVQPSAGVHIVLPEHYCPPQLGLIIPKTNDKRVLFCLPWEGSVIAGTTDSPASLAYEPLATQNDVDWILKELSGYLSVDIPPSHVLATWSGLRPLLLPSKGPDGATEGITRDHVIEISKAGLVTITGGKWTTYRKMAQDTVDTAIKVGGLVPLSECKTLSTMLLGGHGWNPLFAVQLHEHYGVDVPTARHLSHTYGDRAYDIIELMRDKGRGLDQRLHRDYPYTEAEVVYAVRQEYALTVTDVLARRTRLAFLNSEAARSSIDRVTQLMAIELGW